MLGVPHSPDKVQHKTFGLSTKRQVVRFKSGPHTPPPPSILTRSNAIYFFKTTKYYIYFYHSNNWDVKCFKCPLLLYWYYLVLFYGTKIINHTPMFTIYFVLSSDLIGHRSFTISPLFKERTSWKLDMI